MKKKLVALLMAVLMMVSVLPVSAFAFSFGDYVSYRSSLLQSGREYLQSLFFGWQGAAEETPAEEPAPAEEPPAEEPEEAEEESLPLLTSVPKLTTPAPVTYIGADGNKATVSSYTDIPNGFSTTEWAEGTYVVSGDNVQINSSVTLNGDVTLILLDGAKLTIVGTADNGTSGDFPTPQAGLGVNAIDGVAYSLTVTAGATGDTILGTGELDATGGGATRTQPQNWPYICEPRSGIAVKNFTLNGGKLIAKTGARLGDLSGGYASPAPGLYVAETLTVNSGELEAYNTNVVKDNRATAINADQFLLNGGSVYAEGGSDMQEVLYVTSLTLAGGKLTALNDTTGGKAFSSAPTITGNVESCKVGENSSSPTDWDNNTALTSYQYVSLEVTTAATQAITVDGITFQPWTTATSLPTAGGSWYLDTDVTLSGWCNVATGTDSKHTVTNLCLNGHMISASDSGCYIIVADYAELNLYDCATATDHTGHLDEDGKWCSGAGATPTNVKGGIITGFNNAVYVKDNGSFTMYGGTLCGNNTGIGVTTGGTAVMNGGTVSYNAMDSGVGAGVSMDDGSFTLNDGVISHNTVNDKDSGGGGVYIGGGLFQMNGGEISYNSARDGRGGGVCVNPGHGDVTFNMAGGTISSNTALIAGGVNLTQTKTNAVFHMTGGSIVNNVATGACGGVLSFNATFSLSDEVFIKDNTAPDGMPQNLATTVPITVGKLATESEIYVAHMDTNKIAYDTGVLTASYSDMNSGAKVDDFFLYDGPATYEMVLNAAGELEVVEKTHTHDGITFQPWATATSLPADGGNWYLDCDVTLSDEWNVATGTDSKHTVTNLCLNGHVITGVSNKYIVVEDYAELNLYDCATATDHTGHLDENGKWCSGAGATPTNVKGGIITGFEAVFTYNYGSFTMNGGTICGNKTGFGVGRYGTAVMNGGMVAYNYQPEGGAGGVGVAEGSFTLNDGVICYNTCNDEIYYHGGGGVYVNHGGSFTMNGGTVSHNKAENVLGGGVLIENSTFTMLDGVISDNTAPYGGGVFIRKNSIASGDVTISGGSIIRNMATSAVGGVFADSNSVTLSGKVVIKDNTAPDGIPQDLATTTPITVGKLATESEIYAAHADPMYGKYDTGVLTASYSDMNSGAKVDDFFLYDGPDTYEMVLNAAGELEVKMVPVTYVTRSWNDSKVVSTSATCTDYTVVTDETDTFESGWYVVSTDTTIEDRIEVDGTANLILCNGATLTAKAGIEVADGKTLNIYGQSGDSGKLIATGADKSAGIGGSGQGAASGNVTIYGGTVIATGTDGGAGIGGGYQGSASGNVTIYGGTVITSGSNPGGGAGIGAGFFGETGAAVTIYGGTVTATGEGGGAGIGLGGGGDTHGSLTIASGLVVTAGANAAGAAPAADYATSRNPYVHIEPAVVHTHDDVEFQPWTNSTSLPADGGDWYLDCDVELTGTWKISTDTNLCLNGHVIRQTKDGYTVIEVGKGATLNLYDCDERASETDYTHHFTVASDTGLWTLTASETDTYVTGGVITGGGGGGVKVDGTFTMNGGTIAGNKNGYGGGVDVWGGTFTMNGGTIAGNKANMYGGGIFATDNGVVTMNGGTIAGNKANWSGGGVYVDKAGSFVMKGGTIRGNTAGSGGGVFVCFGTFVMTDGTISGNKATSEGGGIANQGAMKLNAGKDKEIIITGNEAPAGGGVLDYGDMELSGKVIIKENNSEGAKNFAVCTDNVAAMGLTTNPVVITGPLTGSEIYVSHVDSNPKFNTGVLTASYTDMSGSTALNTYFHYDGPATYEMVLNAAGELEVVEEVIYQLSLPQTIENVTYVVYVDGAVKALDSTNVLVVPTNVYDIPAGSSVTVEFKAASGYHFTTDGKNTQTVSFTMTDNVSYSPSSVEKDSDSSTDLLTRLFNHTVKIVAATAALNAVAVTAVVAAPVVAPVAATAVTAISTAMAIKLARSILFRPF